MKTGRWASGQGELFPCTFCPGFAARACTLSTVLMRGEMKNSRTSRISHAPSSLSTKHMRCAIIRLKVGEVGDNVDRMRPG